MPKLIALVDSREQTPLTLPTRHWKQQVVTLPIGDYTTTRLLGKYAVERKSLSDFIRTFGQTAEQKRFVKRTKEHPNVVVDLLLEATWMQTEHALLRGLYASAKHPHAFMLNTMSLVRDRGGMIVFGSGLADIDAQLLSAMLLSFTPRKL